VEVERRAGVVSRRVDLHGRDMVKLTVSKGAQLRNPSKLFNSSLEGSARRAIDLLEGGRVDDSAFKALIRDAVARNASARGGKSERLAGTGQSPWGTGTTSGLTLKRGDASCSLSP
jgi:hypothetical protein